MLEIDSLASLLKDSSILITGGTGSFGRAFIQRTLQYFSPGKIIVYSRDEMKQWEMAQQFKNDSRLRFFIGDVRDRDRLYRATKEVDFIIHAAALKIVPAAEYNPFECIKTNVTGAMNVIECAIENEVRRVIALSTDKACSPVNLYGATKLCSDKLFIAGNAYPGSQDTRFAVVRYGNVLGSRGSIIPLFRSLAKSGELLITDERMTRFMITLDQGVEMVWHAMQDAIGGEIYVRKIPSMRVIDIAQTIAPSAHLRFIGIRPGEKLHEQLISVEEARTTHDFGDYYMISPHLEFLERAYTEVIEKNYEICRGKPCTEGFHYSSDTNADWMTKEELRQWIEQEYGTSEAETSSPVFP